MGYKSLVAGLVSSAIAAVGDLAETVTLVKHGEGEYDPDTGTTTPDDTLVERIKAPMPKFSAPEKDDQINIITDCKVLIATNDLPPGVIIEENDEIRVTNEAGTVVKSEWDVKRIMSVPGDSLYILHVRKKR
jgi:hypothetical protein